jgi:hypothetical protein
MKNTSRTCLCFSGSCFPTIPMFFLNLPFRSIWGLIFCLFWLNLLNEFQVSSDKCRNMMYTLSWIRRWTKWTWTDFKHLTRIWGNVKVCLVRILRHHLSFCNPRKIYTSLLFLEFANSNPVEGFNDGTLQMTFTELRQVGIGVDIVIDILVMLLCRIEMSLIIDVL